MNGTLESIIDARNDFYEQAKKLDEVVVALGGESVFGQAPVTTAPAAPQAAPRRAPRATASANAERKRRQRVNSDALDYFTLQSLVNSNEDFATGKWIVEEAKRLGFDMTPTQMRTSVARLTAQGKIEDNGELRAKKRYRATVATNDLPAPEGYGGRSAAAKKAAPAETPSETVTVTTEAPAASEDPSSDTEASSSNESAQAVSTSGPGLTSKEAVSMALAAEDGELPMADIVEAVFTMFPGQFEEPQVRAAINELAKRGEISRKKQGNRNVYGSL